MSKKRNGNPFNVFWGSPEGETHDVRFPSGFTMKGSPKKEIEALFLDFYFMVPGQGFEPRLPGPEPGVLPLDDPGIIVFFYER